ncbi:MAG: serine hydrolase domain-containing protein [Microbacteriaceae bacterium]
MSDPAAVVKAKLPDAANGPLPVAIVSTVDAAVTATMPQSATPGAVVAIRSPQGTWIKAYGVADPATGAAMTDDVYQRVGSVTKTFTGTLVLQLAQQGKLSLDDTISQYLSGIPNGSTVTIRQLLDMTSGLASYTLDSAWQKTFFAQPEKVWTPDELVTVAKSLKPLFKPGAEYNYSNTNTVLLGKLIEKVTGSSYADVLQSRILDPLTLRDTSFPGESAEFPSPHAQGSTMQSPDATATHPVITTDWNPSWGWTAGEMISTAENMLRYDRALGTGQGLLSAHEQEQRLSSFPSPRDTYSYGLAMGCVGGWVGHTGELPGYNSTVYYQTDSDTAVVILTNSDIASGDCTESATLADNPKGIPCNIPAGRLLTAIGAALGHPFSTPPQH